MEYRELNLSRRAFAGAALAAGTLGSTGLKAADSHVELTPSSDMGPFYPIQRIAEEDADLTWIKGIRSGRWAMSLRSVAVYSTGMAIPSAAR